VHQSDFSLFKTSSVVLGSKAKKITYLIISGKFGFFHVSCDETPVNFSHIGEEIPLMESTTKLTNF